MDESFESEIEDSRMEQWEDSVTHVAPVPEILRHGMNCAAWHDTNGYEVNATDCTCGLRFRIHLQTEQTMHAAWRKRAEEAEQTIRELRAKLERMSRPVTDKEINKHALHTIKLGPLEGPLTPHPVLTVSTANSLIRSRAESGESNAE